MLFFCCFWATNTHIREIRYIFPSLLLHSIRRVLLFSVLYSHHRISPLHTNTHESPDDSNWRNFIFIHIFFLPHRRKNFFSHIFAICGMFRWRRADELRCLITATRWTGNESSQRESSRTGEWKKCQLPHNTEASRWANIFLIRQFHDFRINLMAQLELNMRPDALTYRPKIDYRWWRRRWSAGNTHRE